MNIRQASKGKMVVFVFLALVSISASFFNSAIALDCSEEYNRSCYKHWTDDDRDGQNTREEALERESLVPVTYNEAGKIIAGLWLSTYDGTIHTEPGTLDLDHIIALGHVHRIGGQFMTPEQKQAIANDPLNLILVTAGSNRQKSDHSGGRWIIPNLAWLSEFLDRQHQVRTKYRLIYEPCERDSIQFERWVAKRTEKGIRIYRATNYEDTVTDLLADGTLKRKYEAWKTCQESIE